MSTVCLAMIVRDEAKVIERCLSSVLGFIDCWYIIDTGSTDETKSIILNTLSSVKGELVEREWFNFGYNRSQLVSEAKDKADYILLLDADMTVNFAKHDKDFTSGAYMIRYEGDIDYAQTLLVKSDLSWSYHGVTHEYIDAPEPYKIEEIKHFTIQHHCDGTHRKHKYERDVDLLKKGLKNDPNNSRYMFYLAQSYKDLNNFSAAANWYKKRVDHGGWDQEVFYSQFQYGMMLMKSGETFEKFSGELLKAYQIRPTRSEPLYELAKWCRQNQFYDLGYMFAKQGVQISYPDDVLFVHKNVYDYLMLDELSICSYYVGKIEESKSVTLKLLDSTSIDKDRIRNNLSFCLSNSNMNELKKKGEFCSVIGNGPVENDWSDYIESSYCMRCNNFKTGPEWPNVGSNTNLRVASLYEGTVNPSLFSSVFSAIPLCKKRFHAGHINPKIEELFRLEAQGQKVFWYDSSDDFYTIFDQISKDIDGYPTVGLVAIALAKYLGFEKILLAGFSFYSTDEMYYFPKTCIRPGKHHNISGEVKIVNKWISEEPDRYILDPVVGKALNASNCQS